MATGRLVLVVWVDDDYDESYFDGDVDDDDDDDDN